MVSYRKKRDRQPKLTYHKASGQGVVRTDGKDVYCGPYSTASCEARDLLVLAAREAVDRPSGNQPEGGDGETLHRTSGASCRK